MSEHEGPPDEVARERRDMAWVRQSQQDFFDGYHARMAQLHPFKKNREGKVLLSREPRWSYAEMAEDTCPGSAVHDRFHASETAWPAHRRERWLAGWAMADGIASTRGSAAMRTADPAKPRRAKRAVLATQMEAVPEFVLTPAEAKAASAAAERRRATTGPLYHAATPRKWRTPCPTTTRPAS